MTQSKDLRFLHVASSLKGQPKLQRKPVIKTNPHP
jgi:hypothetical protein